MILDLVIPFYNPSSGWEKKFTDKYIKLIDAYFDGRLQDINLIIVNDGSVRNFTDTEIGYLRNRIPDVRVVSYEQNMGKGHALREGVKKADTGYCIFTDFDFPFGLQVVHDIFRELKNGADIVTGSRLHGNYFSSIPFKRKMISKAILFFNKRILRLSVHDTQAGIKGFNKYGKALFLKTTINRFLFDMEFILLASRVKNVVIKPLNVNITHETRLSDFGMKVMKQEFRNLLKILFKKSNGATDKENII